MKELLDFNRFLKRIIQILPYIKVSLGMLIASMIFGTILGIIVALINIKKIPVIKQLLQVYISFMRGTPLLVQMMIVYYGLPLLIQSVFNIDINGWNTIIFVDIAIVLNEGAFLGEIFRSAITSVDHTQKEAALTVGMTNLQAYRRIIIPQAIRIALPPYGVDMIGVFHNTSLAYSLGVIDLMGRAKTLGVADGHSLEGFLVVTLIYVLFCLILRLIFKKINKNISYGRRAKI